MSHRAFDPETSTLALGVNADTASPLAIPYYLSGDKLVVSASLLLDSFHEHPVTESDNLYIALGNSAVSQNTEIVFAGGLCRLDLNKRELHVDGNHVDLTPTEFTLLNIHGRNLDKVVPLDYTEELLWGHTNDGGRWVDSPVLRHITNIRAAFDRHVPGLGDRDAGAFRVISNVGHVLCADFLDMANPDDGDRVLTGIRSKQVNTGRTYGNDRTRYLEKPKLHIPDDSTSFAGGVAILNRLTEEVTTREKSVRLSKGELRFLSLLAADLGKFVSNKTIAGELWGISSADMASNRINSVLLATRKRLNMVRPGLGHATAGAIATVPKRGCILLDELEA